MITSCFLILHTSSKKIKFFSLRLRVLALIRNYIEKNGRLEWT